MHTDRQEFLGLEFDQCESGALLAMMSRITDESHYQYIVTPNVDHMVRLNRPGSGSSVWSAYRNADYCVCDSRVLRLLARLRGVRLFVVPGSDLTASLFKQVIRPFNKIAVVGGDQSLRDGLEARFPGIRFVQHRPPMDLATNPSARREAAEFVAREKARFSFIAVGSPQQELIAAEVRKTQGPAGMALCIGASLNFLTGREPRAPRIMQRLSLEWAFRLASDPRAMWRRYLLRGPAILLLVLRWRRRRRA